MPGREGCAAAGGRRRLARSLRGRGLAADDAVQHQRVREGLRRAARIIVGGVCAPDGVRSLDPAPDARTVGAEVQYRLEARDGPLRGLPVHELGGGLEESRPNDRGLRVTGQAGPRRHRPPGLVEPTGRAAVGPLSVDQRGRGEPDGIPTSNTSLL